MGAVNKDEKPGYGEEKLSSNKVNPKKHHRFTSVQQ